MPESSPGRRGRGRILVVAGPDGAGKTSLADALARRLGSDVLRLHHRPGVLPTRTADQGPVTQPHRQAPYGRAASVAKLVYLWADYLLGWWLTLGPARRGGRHVILERGWWDLLVDPRRYRLRAPPWLVAALGRMLPRPDLTVVLTADPAVLSSRKDELGDAELSAQITRWRRIAEHRPRVLELDAAADREELTRTVESTLRRSTPLPARSELPGLRDPRVNLPARPGSAARAGLLLYHPVTAPGRAAWHLARFLAPTGALGWLRPGAPVDPTVEALVRPHVPPDSLLAVGRSNHPGRWTALAVSPSGRPLAVAKVAVDADGRAALRAEHAALQRHAGALQATVRAPRVLGQAPGVLVLTAVPWRPRSRPWHLPPEVSRAAGHLFASSPSPGSGPCHGDLAPWNLLRTATGWHLIDWAASRLEAPPYFDVLHYLVQGHALLGRPGRGALLRGLEGRGWIGEALLAYAGSSGCPTPLARRHLPDYLTSTARLLNPEREDEARGLAARHRLLEALP